jgi:hypothetical protein
VSGGPSPELVKALKQLAEFQPILNLCWIHVYMKYTIVPLVTYSWSMHKEIVMALYEPQ